MGPGLMCRHMGQPRRTAVLRSGQIRLHRRAEPAHREGRAEGGRHSRERVPLRGTWMKERERKRAPYQRDYTPTSQTASKRQVPLRLRARVQSSSPRAAGQEPSR